MAPGSTPRLAAWLSRSGWGGLRRRGTPQDADIGSILRSVGGLLVADQILEPDILCRYDAEPSLDTLPPCGREIRAARNHRQQINPDGRNAELEDAVRVHDILDRVVEIGAPEEAAQRIESLLGVRASRLDQDIEDLSWPADARETRRRARRLGDTALHGH